MPPKPMTAKSSFLSKDSDSGSKMGWHSGLEAEISDCNPRLLNGGISQLIDDLAAPAAEPSDIMGLLGGSVVTGVVASSYAGPDVFFSLLSRSLPPDGQSGNAAGSRAPKMTPAETAGKAHAYSIDRLTWLSVRARWRGEKDCTIIVGSSGALGGPITKPVSWPSQWSGSVQFEVENTLLIEISRAWASGFSRSCDSGILKFRDCQALG
jgi:hypothetical protein